MQDPSPLSTQLLSHPADSQLLHLKSLPLTSSDLPQLFAFLQNNPSISQLSLDSISHDPNVFSANAFKLLENPLQSLTKLSFEAIPLHKSLDFLPVFLENLPELTALHIKNCSLSDEDCEILCKILKQCPAKLVSLDLSRNKIKSLGANQLVLALQINTKLKELNLLGNEGVDSRTSSDLQRLLQRNFAISSQKPATIPTETAENRDEFAGQRRFAEEKERELVRLREISQRNDEKKREFLLKHSALLQEQALLKAEELALQEEFQLISQKKGFSEETLALKLENGRFQGNQAFFRQEQEFLEISQQFSRDFAELTQRSFEKYAKLVEDYQLLENIKEELDCSVISLKEEILRISLETEDRVQNFQEKFLQESAKSFEKTRIARESALLSLRNEKKFEEMRAQELKKELQKRESRDLEKLEAQSVQIFKEKQKINEFHHKLSEKTLEIEKKRVVLISLDESLRVACVSLEETRRDLEIEKDHKIYEKSLRDDAFFNEERLFSQEIAQLQARLAEIQGLLQVKIQENARIRAEYAELALEVKSRCAQTLRNVVKPEFY